MGSAVHPVDRMDDSSDSESDSDLPTAAPPTEDLLNKWDEQYETAWLNRDRRAESNDIFSLERESGESLCRQ